MHRMNTDGYILEPFCIHHGLSNYPILWERVVRRCCQPCNDTTPVTTMCAIVKHSRNISLNKFVFCKTKSISVKDPPKTFPCGVVSSNKRAGSDVVEMKFKASFLSDEGLKVGMADGTELGIADALKFVKNLQQKIKNQ
uniref:Uncharacterized protein n=1 Tax=Ditylum brightwellii TaxID=49249 RepID=A0A6U3PJI4_9STRA|mmetsp:Transcript_14680/g.21890  ORF Transcript_14680/g.21890 Transcript_14680/m.21890 type:complete len:139 (+) Transcript_14680:694-1110(+)